jgi:hypothetical protein
MGDQAGMTKIQRIESSGQDASMLGGRVPVSWRRV